MGIAVVKHLRVSKDFFSQHPEFAMKQVEASVSLQGCGWSLLGPPLEESGHFDFLYINVLDHLMVEDTVLPAQCRVCCKVRLEQGKVSTN